MCESFDREEGKWFSQHNSPMDSFFNSGHMEKLDRVTAYCSMPSYPLSVSPSTPTQRLSAFLDVLSSAAIFRLGNCH